MSRFSAAPPLETPRLRLEPVRVEHATEMAALLGGADLYAFTGGTPPTAAQLRDRYRRQVAGRSPDGAQAWLNWVLRTPEDGQPIGYVQATVVEDRGDTVAEVAWVVGAAHQGRGYAREAAAAMVAWLHEQGTDVVVAHVHPHHLASQAVARAVGLAPGTTVIDGEVRWQARQILRPAAP